MRYGVRSKTGAAYKKAVVKRNSNVAHRNNTNRIRGKTFETLFERMGTYSGLLVRNNPLSCRVLPGGRLLRIRSNLDFTVINRLGDVAFVDCKNFESDAFTYSQINDKQLALATLYNQWNVIAGFCCWFRQTNRVGFFSGNVITKGGSGTRFTLCQGLDLGSPEALNLGLIFLSAPSASQCL